MSKSQIAELLRRFMKNEFDIMSFRHNEVNLHLMIIKTSENVHKICFWLIWMAFKFHLKINLIMF